MATVENALNAIRHVVQDHSDEGTHLGVPADMESIHWFGRLLGWEWPPSYVELLSRHNGVNVQDAIVFGFLESIEIMLQHRETWRHQGYWPVATDGCGNFFVMALGQRVASGEGPVIFLDAAAETNDQPSVVATSYPDFIVDQMRQQCEGFDCTELAESGAADASGG